MPTPLVSVITPNYNYARFLRQRLDSILNQTYQHLELIILDDCSTDDSRLVIEEYRNNERVTHIVMNDKNSGSTFKQWKKGFALARGEFIWIAEADDYAEPTLLEALLGEMTADERITVGFVNSQWELPDQTFVNPDYTIPEHRRLYDGRAFVREHLLKENYIYNASMAVFRKAALEGISEDYLTYRSCGDKLFWKALAQQGRVLFVCEPLNHFRIHQSKVTTNSIASGLLFEEENRFFHANLEEGYIDGSNRLEVIRYFLQYVENVKGDFLSEEVYQHCKQMWQQEYDSCKKRISVVIPIYNVQHYIEECLASVAAQTYQDFDVIAVDDCCTDFSMQVFYACLETLHFDMRRVTVVHHERNRGLSAARNSGLQASLADYVYFLDSDDTITPDCLERLAGATHVEGQDVDMVIGDYRFDGPELGCPHLRVGKPFLNRWQYIRAYCKEQIFPMAWNRLMRREFLLQHQLFFEEGLIHEDTLWNFQMLQYVQTVSIVEHETYIYRVRQQSIQTSTAYERHFKANAHILACMAKTMFSTSLRFNKYVYNFVEQEKLRHLYDCYRNDCAYLVRELYTVCRSNPHYHPFVAILLFGWNEGILRRILKRDMHYRYSFEKGLRIFADLPKTL